MASNDRGPQEGVRIPRKEEQVTQEPVVLVLDDDEDVRESLADLLDSVGMQSLSYSSANDLLEAGLPDRPCCLILDIRIPGTSGLDLQDRLLEMQIDVPIIFITGYADVAMSVRAMKAGAVDFLPKPFHEQVLLDAVDAALQKDMRHRAERSALGGLRALAARLTPRELDILDAVRRGLLNKQIAFELGLAEVTVKMHRSSASRKLQANSTADLIRKLEQLDLHRSQARLVVQPHHPVGSAGRFGQT